MMTRFHQRLQKRMQNPEFAAGFREMEGELALLQALEAAREAMHISKKELARRMGKQRETITRLLNSSDANPTLETLTELLSALGLTADITLRPARENETPIRATFHPSAQASQPLPQ